VVDPIDYRLELQHPDRDEPERSDFTSFTGEIAEGDVLALPEKGEWRVEEVRDVEGLPNQQLVCVPA
jgi:hypothetical protein